MKEIIRRLLLAFGGLAAAVGFAFGLLLIFSSTYEKTEGWILASVSVGGFFAWRELVHWILVYKG